MDTELLKAAVLHPGDEQQLNGTTTSVNVDVHRAVEHDGTSLNLVRNEEICRAVRSFQQISLPWSNKCCCGHGTNKIGRIKYIFLVSIIMIAPMEFNAFSFLLPFASPLDDTAYFDGCYQYLGSDYHATHFPYLDCLACNNNVPYVNTSGLNSKPQNQAQYLAASGLVGVVALFFAAWYVILATRALSYGALLSYGVYTEITPVFCASKGKMLILLMVAAYSVFGAWCAVGSAQTLEGILETLTIGDSAGLCYQDVSGMSSKAYVHASFSANNPAVTHLDASTSSVKSAILTYATAIFVYVPILLSFYGVLAHPYNSFDAGELFEGVEDTADGSDTSGNILRKNNSVASTTTNGEKTIAKVIQENIRFRIREEALHAAVVKVHKRWSEPRKASLTWLESNPVFFLVHWASSSSAEDIALVEEVVRLAMESEAVPESF